MHPISAFRKIWNVDKNGNILRMRTCFRHRHRHSAETPLNRFYSFGLWTRNEIRLESYLSMSGYKYIFGTCFHMSKSHPGMHASNPGDFGHGPFLVLKGSLDITSIHMGLLYLCDYYTTPEIKILFFLFRLSTESLTTISIACFLCPSKEGTKACTVTKYVRNS